MHLRWRLAVGRHLEFEFQSVDMALVAGCHNKIGRTQQRDAASCHRFAESAVHMAAYAFGEKRPKLVLRATQHCRPRDDVLGNRMLHEQVRRNDRNTAAGYCGIIEHSAGTAPMIGMRVAEYDRA